MNGCERKPKQKKEKKHAEKNKANNSPNKIESKDVKLKIITRKKIRVGILGDSMLNDIWEKGLNKNTEIVTLVKETCKDTKLCFSILIYRTDLKDIDEKVIKTNTHLENYCKQQNLDFTDNSNIRKSDLISRGLHLQERSSSKLIKIFLDYLYWVCITGNSFLDQSEQSKICIIKKLRKNKLSHPKFISLGHLNINSIQNKFSSISYYFLL